MISLRDIIKKILNEDSKIGSISGTQEKELNTGLRTIHNKFKDDWNSINTKTKGSRINYGGCGIFAKLLYYNLKKYLNVTPEIVFITNDTGDGISDINKYQSFLELNETDHICIHICLKLNNYYIDSSGIHRWNWFANIYKRYNPIELNNMSISTLTNWVRNNNNWNNSFDRYTTGDINTDMKKILQKVSDLKKEI